MTDTVDERDREIGMMIALFFFGMIVCIYSLLVWLVGPAPPGTLVVTRLRRDREVLTLYRM